jgi:hypothetical protein
VAGTFGVKTLTSFYGLQTVTITGTYNLTPTNTRIEFNVTSPTVVTLLAGSLPAGTVVIVIRLNPSSNVTVNGSDLDAGTQGTIFILASDGSWYCVGGTPHA